MDGWKLTVCTWISSAGGVAWNAMKKRTVVLLAPVVLFGALQLIPVSRSNPPVVTPMKWDSDETKALADRACMDCHSNQTRWPWYSYVAPVSLFVAHHVEDGRSKLNFDDLNAVREGRSEWVREARAQEGGEANEAGEAAASGDGSSRVEKIMHEIEENIEEGEMPLESYYPMHPAARLTEEEKAKLIQGLHKSIAATLGK